MSKCLCLVLVAGLVVGLPAAAPAAQPEDSPKTAAAAEGAARAAGESLNKGLVALATALAIAVAAFAGTLAQGRAAAAAFEGISRNPGARKDLFVPFVLALVLIESLVIYALIIAFILSAKVG